jgi:hypothetical protein
MIVSFYTVSIQVGFLEQATASVCSILYLEDF